MPRIPIKFTPHPHLADHHFMGQPVLPAVEAMEILAAAVKQEAPDQSVTSLTDARFDKFLAIDLDQQEVAAFADMQPLDEGTCQAHLATKTKAPKAAITRTKIHAQLTFKADQEQSEFAPLDVAAAPEGICTTIEPERIYKELVPFGTAYANIKTPVWLSPDGAMATIESPDLPTVANSSHLGSPFTLDAAFHAACVWGQHFHNVVAFPVAIGKRLIMHPTRPNRRYYGRVVPKAITPALFNFDIWLLDETGRVCEIVLDLQMRDVSAGRLKPPEWIVHRGPIDPLAALRRSCRQLTLIELDAVAPYASAALSPLEAGRLKKMATLRSRSYLAARMALKRLSRRVQGNELRTEPQNIPTVCDDLIKPCCPASGVETQVRCSASHDARFAVAVAADQPVGVDVEVVSAKPVECSDIYMSEQETDLMARSALGEAQAATRIWSLKEAVAKALDMDLATSWRRAQVCSIGEHESRFDLDGKEALKVEHASVGEHLFTLFCHKPGTLQ